MQVVLKDEKTGVLYRRWESPSARAVFLLVHGLGAHSARWEFLADFFFKSGISSYAIELKGFGETKDLKGHIDSFNVYFDDIKSLRRIIKEENAGKKMFLVGESLGALISFLMVIAEPGLFDALICISPAFANRLKTAPLDYVKILLSFIYNPKKQFNIPFDAPMCTRDADYQKVMDADAREHRLATSKLILEIIIAQMRSNILKKRLRTPALFLLSGNDKLADPETSKRIFGGLGIEDKALIQYPEMHHALSIDLGRERVFGDILNWIKKRI